MFVILYIISVQTYIPSGDLTLRQHDCYNFRSHIQKK